MKITIALELMNKYATCPKCGNDKIGPGKGSVAVKDKSFERSCSCGWSVEISEEGDING